ncbi:MAG TPA: hypothetical protein VEQ15_08665 [Myxococcales bacterium]|jgi:hypothetical protein|nr:hypothetical protein [Myxococcales bacterium]
MTIRGTEAFWLAVAIASAAGCSGSSPASSECQGACQRVVTCSATPYAYAYSFNFAYAYNFGYGLNYGGADLQQCLNDCAAVPQASRERIAQCVIGASDCLTLLRCN